VKDSLRRAADSVLMGLALAVVLIGALPAKLARSLRFRRRSLWTGTPIITMAVNARAERTLGTRALSLVTSTYRLTSAFDVDLSGLRGLRWIGRAVPFAVFAWAALWVDRIHFYCDRGLLPSQGAFDFNPLELQVYRLLGIDVFLWAYGADVRSRQKTMTFGEPNCCTDCTQVGVACICDDSVAARHMARLRRLSRAIFSMGDMIEYTPGSRNDLFYWPVDLESDGGNKYRPRFPDSQEGYALRVVHAPNHRMFKGTRFLERAVAELREEGVAIELVLVESLPNDEALEVYRSADLIFDQCLVGFHGYFALEGMALGKPVMCFIREPARYLLAAEECPLVNTHVMTLKSDLRALARDRARLQVLGRQGRSYIEKHFTPEAFARRLRRAYEELGVAV
jgi:glycosyltransferase involved in cell wall biosynthesis